MAVFRKLPVRPRVVIATASIPPHAYFLISAVFHYLGPAFAVLLFAHVSVLGVAWLRVATAALIFAAWRRPWRRIGAWSPSQRRAVIALGIVLGLMNVSFYLAIDRLPLSTVGAIEFAGTIALAALGVRTWRNLAAVGLAVIGVVVLIDVRLASEPLGVLFALANCGLFLLYVVLGHRLAGEGESIDRLGAAMLVALVAVTPLGIGGAVTTFGQVNLLIAGIGVGLCSSVIPYVSDQLAMARLPRATFALLLATLPAWATVIGAVVLGQVPSVGEVAGVALVVGGVAIHQAE